VKLVSRDRPLPTIRIRVALARQRFGVLACALRAPRPAVLLRIGLAVLLGASLLLHLVLIGTTHGARDDIEAYGIQAASVFHHLNVYTVTTHYPYPPVWIWIVAAAQWCATALHLPFDQVVKLPATAADLAIAGVLYVFMRERVGACWLALLPAALDALNPTAILITAGHGQFDALVMLFALLAITLRGPQQDRRFGASGLALGVAIALKGFPILLLPYLAATAPKGKRRLTVAAACVPLAVSAAIYIAIFGFTPLMLTHVLGYHSPDDLGWIFLLRQIPLLGTAIIGTSLGSLIALVSLLLLSEVFIVGFAVAVPARRFPGQPAAAVTLIFAVLYATTTTLSGQNLVWILPFAVLAVPLAAVVFTLIAFVAYIALAAASPTLAGALPSGVHWAGTPLASPALHVLGALAIIVWSAIMMRQLLQSRAPDAATYLVSPQNQSTSPNEAKAVPQAILPTELR
jgi:Glycosyltransferase family 87